jgi:poly-gamma-glutamate synthesis protein (capsule biosynthesis protein)
VLGVADHPAEFAATPNRPGTAIADLRAGVPAWLTQTLSTVAGSADAVLLTPHWGPNFTPKPLPHIHSAAKTLSRQVTLIAGHSAHVFHGVEGNVLFDLGDFLQTYPGERDSGSIAWRALRRVGGALRSVLGGERRRRPKEVTGPAESLVRRKLRQAHRLLLELRAARLRDDLGLVFLVALDPTGPRRVEALPLKLAHCYTGLAEGADAAWIGRRFRRACQALGTQVAQENGRLVITGNRPLARDVEP